MQVYLIQNLANGKVYVGQHSGEDLQVYLRSKIRMALSNTKRGCSYLYAAIRKYGSENFTIRCIHKCVDKAEMDRAEKAYIKLFGTRDPELGYNLTDGGDGALGVVKSVSEETKEILRIACSGWKHTDAAKEKIRITSLGRKHSDATKEKMRDSAKARGMPEKALRAAWKSTTGGTMHSNTKAALLQSYTSATYKNNHKAGIKAAWERRRQRATKCP